MSIITNKEYNYQFDSSACEACGGHCCSGESGYIYLNNDEIKRLVDFLQIDIVKFYKEYLIKVGYKFSLIEYKKDDVYNCIFFQDGKCSVYDVRPNQCRTFPFWDYYKNNFQALKEECPGVVLLNR